MHRSSSAARSGLLAAALAASAALSLGCHQPTPTPVAPRASQGPATTAPSPDAGPATTADAAPVAVADAAVDASAAAPTIEVQERACALRVRDGALGSDCPREVLTCAEVLRADLAPEAGDEVVSRCDQPQQVPVFLVVSRGEAVLASVRLDNADDGTEACEASPDLRIEAVDAVADAPRELLVRATGCHVPGSYADWDALFRWSDGDLREIARGSLSCSYRGSTGDPDAPPPPRNARYICGGGYLDLTGPPTAPTLSTREFEDRVVSGNRGRDGRTLLGRGGRVRALRWNPTAGRFDLQP